MPLRLYKYEPLTMQALHNLKSQIIYFGSPLSFNDPYDCALTLNIKTPSDNDVEAIRKIYLRKDELPAAVRAQFYTFGIIELREVLLRAARDAIVAARKEFLEARGVACFSERNDDLLMWSHYGGRYKGFCLEFSTTSEPFTKIKQVRYLPILPAVDVATILIDPDFDPVQELFCTKAKAWAYEEEWRAIHNIAGTEFGYPSETLTGIYFGPDIDPQSLEIICLIIGGQNTNVRLWRGARSTTEFRVLFEEFQYMSYLQTVDRRSS